MAVITVNGAAMPAPSTLKVTIFDVASTADRNASGQVVMDRVGTKRKLEMTWAHLTPAQLSQLLQAVGTDVFFTAGYPDPQTAQMVCLPMLYPYLLSQSSSEDLILVRPSRSFRYALP